MKRKDDRHKATQEPRLREREVPTPPELDDDAKFVVQLLPEGGMILHYPMTPSIEIGAPVAARAFEHTLVPGPSDIQ